MFSMTVGTMQMFSPALDRIVPYTILLPAPEMAGPGPYPVLLQLHGYHDTHSAWLQKSKLVVHAERWPFIVVLPDGQNSFWADLSPGDRYESFLVDDLWTHINHMYAVRADRWAIGGLSMGGFGALRLGLRHPGKFCSIYAHSSVINLSRRISVDERLKHLAGRDDLDCNKLAEQIDPARLPRLGFDCGVDDSLIGQNRGFHEQLTALKLPHDYHEHPGAHTWDYWDRHVPAALRQHGEVMQVNVNSGP